MLLSKTKLENIQLVHSTIRGLLINFSRYPQDRNLILNTLKSIGENHFVEIEFIIEDLLVLDSKFLSREANIQDICYIGIMIACFNAAHKYVFCPPHLPTSHFALMFRRPDLTTIPMLS